MRDQPEQQAPPVQRLRIRYAKRGRLRFTSHRDFSRAFERAVFRARVPMAYSSGFNPHPRISYAGAAPTGSASEAEYLEIALAEVVDPAAIGALLEEALPDGLDIVEIVESPGGALADRLEASHWLIDLAADPDEARSRGRRLPRRRRGLGRADDQEGSARVRLPGRGLSTLAAGRSARLDLRAAPRRTCCPSRRRAVRAGVGRRLAWTARRCSPGSRRARSTPLPERSATRCSRRR